MPAPSVASAIVATLTSLPSETRGPSSSWSAPASGNEPSQLGRLRAVVTVPSASSTSPGEPTPIELSSDGSASAAAAAPRTAAAISAARRPARPWSGSAGAPAPTTWKRSSTTTAWIFVPPRSTPARRFIPPLNKIDALASRPHVRSHTSRPRPRALPRAPETSERPSHGSPAFFIRDKKTFVMYLDDHHGDGRLALWCAAPAGMQAALVQGEPEHYFVPPYVGHRGWVGVHLNRGLDWNEIAGAIEEAYLTVAPKRLAEEAVRARG